MWSTNYSPTSLLDLWLCKEWKHADKSTPTWFRMCEPLLVSVCLFLYAYQSAQIPVPLQLIRSLWSRSTRQQTDPARNQNRYISQWDKMCFSSARKTLTKYPPSSFPSHCDTNTAKSRAVLFTHDRQSIEMDKEESISCHLTHLVKPYEIDVMMQASLGLKFHHVLKR